MLDYPLGQGLDVGVGDGEGQEQFQEFIVLQGPGASREEALPEAGAVPVVMWFCRFFRHVHFLLLRQGLKCNREKQRRPRPAAACLRGFSGFAITDSPGRRKRAPVGLLGCGTIGSPPSWAL